ncbi:putative terpene synthase metal binding domain protein [Diplodia seriata]|uniref:Putative terpene synthase metal binding domain protein n=1 Tax=Diplodia seriata TaxID=420778 RepID=A0A0G2GH21_9PEZI|nr:putative terpene synthase metal binding domain protein [Diplodia seriata]
MEISQTRFVGPPTPTEARTNADMATLPDLFVLFIAPEPKVNPHYEEVKRESEEWMRQNLWKNMPEHEIKKRCGADFCFFSAVMCPDAGKEEFRTLCDWIYWVFEFDDPVRERYVKSNVHFCHSVAELHGEEFDGMVVMENIRRYLQVRAQNIGLYPLLALEDQNDILSYHREHSVGHSQNLISIFRRRLGLTQQQSYDRADELLHRCYQQWYVAHAAVPCWGEKVDAQVQQYLKACLDVLRANVRWR